MYQRIDKGDGSIQDLTREQLAERLAKFVSLVDEEIGRIDAGHVVADDFAWYQRKFVPGLRGTPSQQDQPATPDVERESFTVVYGGRFYEISEGGMDALAEYGAEVCGREMSSEQATYNVLKAEGLDVPEPDALEPDVLGALARLHAEAAYLEQRFFSGDYGPRRDEHSNEMRLLYPRIHEALGAACVVIGKLRDDAIKSPRLLDHQAQRETVIFERLKLAITSWLLRNQFFTDEVRFYTRSEWTLRRETVGRNSVLAMTFEGSVLYHILNDTFGDRAMSARLEDEFRRLLAEHGFYYELGYAWCLSLYPLNGEQDGV
jgi:hypothetical protein